MNRTAFTFATLAACLAACAVCVLPAVAAPKGESKGGDESSTLSVKYKEADAADPYGKNTFKGKVGPKACAKGRSVSIKSYGKEKTNKKGVFEFELDGPADPGRYKVKLAAKDDCSSAKVTLRVPRA